jgi:hypothetical protein
LGAIVAVVGGTDLGTVDAGQASTNHRRQLWKQGPCGQHGAHRRHLFWLDIDDETVRRIWRNGFLPGLEQIAADHGQQHQGHETEGQGDDLHDAGGRPSFEAGQTIAPADAARPAGAAARCRCQADCQTRNQGENGQGDSESTDHVGAQRDFAGDPEHERRESHETEQIAAQQAGLRASQLAAQDAQRGHLLELQQGRNGKTEEQQQAHRHALHDR